MNRIKDIVIVIICVVFVLKLSDVNLFHNLPLDQKYLPAEMNTDVNSFLARKHLQNVDKFSNKMLLMVNKTL